MDYLTAYQPSWRDRIANWMLGDDPTRERTNFVQGLLGSRGMGPTGMGVVDATPIGGLLAAQEAARGGDYRGAAMAVMPMGGVAGREAKQGLSALEREALRAPSFDAFKKGFLQDIKHGRYFHITDDPNFKISPELGPRDMTSLGMGGVSQKDALMLTSHPEYWLEDYANRPYIAEIDVSKLPYDALKQVNRGMGNEFYVPNASQNLSVMSVRPTKTVLKDYERYRSTLPQSESELRALFERARQSGLLGPN